MGSELDDAVKRALAAEPLPGKRVIDFRCGSGELGLWMAGEGAEVYLVDFDRATVDAALARAKVEGLERRVRGILVEGPRLDMFADRGFDLAYLRAMPDRPLLAEVARAMKPGSRLVLSGAEAGAGGALNPWFGAVQAEWPPKGGWLDRLHLGKKKPGGSVITARRAG